MVWVTAVLVLVLLAVGGWFLAHSPESRTIRLEWERTTAASIEATWGLLHDTDRFSQVVRSGNRMTRQEVSGRVQTVGSSKMGGTLARWVEAPFDFEKPHWLKIERHMDAGPMLVYRTDLALEATGAGTRVRYGIELVPRTPWAWLGLLWFSRNKVHPFVSRKVDEALQLLEGSDVAGLFSAKVPALEAQAATLLDQRLDGIPEPFAGHLREWVRHAPLTEQERLMPLRQARLWATDPDQTVRAALQAVEQGVLVLQWELLCPNCRGAEAITTELPDGPVGVHCGSCNIRYDGSFLDGVGIAMHTSPELRELPRTVHCAMSPSRTPHVLARAELGPGKALGWRLRLGPGSYRIDADQTPGAATLEVREGYGPERVRLDLTQRGMAPQRTVVRAGWVEVEVRSRLGAADTVVLQDRAFPSTVLTASRFLETPGARELLPRRAITPGITTEARHGWVIAVDILRGRDPERVSEVIARHQPLRCSVGPHRALASWGTGAPAVAALAELAELAGVSSALAEGSLLEVGEHGLGGRAVQWATDTARLGGVGRALLHRSAVESEAVTQALQDQALGTHPFVAPHRQLVARVPPSLDLEPPAEGDRVGSFTLQTPLARGGFGAVWAARSDDGTAAAVKVLHPNHAASPDYVELFYEEARLLAQLHHPSLVRVLDWGFSADGRLFLAMARLFGESLEEERRRGPLDPVRAAIVCIYALEALDAAHSAGVVHCDVKPANLVVHADISFADSRLNRERVTVVDFGIASPLAARFDLVPNRDNGFMPPEQLQGHELDHRVDIFAVGKVLGALVEPGNEALEAIVNKATADDPSQRYDNAGAMIAALERWVEVGP